MLQQLQSLIRPMDLPHFRKSGTTHKNLEWLHKNLKVRNESHKNYEPAMEVLKDLLKIKK